MANKARCIQLGNIAVGKSWDNPQSGRIYSVDGIAPTLNTCGGGGRTVCSIMIFQKIRRLMWQK